MRRQGRARPDRLEHPPARRRLRAEGRLVERLSHPHIVRAYELIERPQPVLVLEALTGETLAYTIEQRATRLSAAELAALGLHLCSAIAYVHRQGFLHLDLKPSNVVNELGQAKLIDFSIARRPGRARGSAGTRVYMAPEQEGGSADRGDRRLGDRRRALRGRDGLAGERGAGQQSGGSPFASAWTRVSLIRRRDHRSWSSRPLWMRTRKADRAVFASVCEHVFVPDEGTILHADLDSFYASVEQRDDPRCAAGR